MKKKRPLSKAVFEKVLDAVTRPFFQVPKQPDNHLEKHRGRIFPMIPAKSVRIQIILKILLADPA
jgi:uncharacterized protein YcgL (UPF0745 family)